MLVMITTVVAGQILWSGPWLLLTVVGAALTMPFHVRSLAEMDERFDGIVYTVAWLAGATCVIHLNNLPQVASASPFHDALRHGAMPGLRDLLIVGTSPGFAGELGQGLMMIMAGVLVGAMLGVLHMLGRAPGRIAAACAVVGLAAIGADVVGGGAWPIRALLVVAALALSVRVRKKYTRFIRKCTRRSLQPSPSRGARSSRSDLSPPSAMCSSWQSRRC